MHFHLYWIDMGIYTGHVTPLPAGQYAGFLSSVNWVSFKQLIRMNLSTSAHIFYLWNIFSYNFLTRFDIVCSMYVIWYVGIVQNFIVYVPLPHRISAFWANSCTVAGISGKSTKSEDSESTCALHSICATWKRTSPTAGDESYSHNCLKRRQEPHLFYCIL